MLHFTSPVVGRWVVIFEICGFSTCGLHWVPTSQHGTTRGGKFFVCENPKDSIFWFTAPWVERKFTANDTEQIHQACPYGSTRPKWTKLNANFVETLNVNQTCDGQHNHASWGLQQSRQRKVFATALEVHYPSLLCDAIAETSLLHYIAWVLSLQPHSLSLCRPGRLPTIKLAQPRYPPLCRSTKGNC